MGNNQQIPEKVHDVSRVEDKSLPGFLLDISCLGFDVFFQIHQSSFGITFASPIDVLKCRFFLRL